MTGNSSFKLFISYSHCDESLVEEFRKQISPLKTNGLVDEWYDRKIIAGEFFQDTIDNNLDNADLVCLFISANFLSSKACLKEKDTAVQYKKQKGISVITIILAECAWLDISDLSEILALPTDGRAICSYPSHDTGWMDVYIGIKKAIEYETKIRNIRITDTFNEYLADAGMFSRAHSSKSVVEMDDIYVYPDLIKLNDLGIKERKINASNILEELCVNSKIILIGDSQSGKTSLCKMIFKKLRAVNYIPIIVTDDKHYEGHICSRIESAFNEQYLNISYADVNTSKIVPIIDDFQIAHNKEVIIHDLGVYKFQVLIVDEIFSLNIKDERASRKYVQYKIKEYSPLLRDSLIRKWLQLTDQNCTHDANGFYKSIDDATELVNSSLGKIFSSGIMPSYPFFILSVLSTREIFGKPLDEEISSQGYCYQALIYMYLRKQGVKNDEVDIYLNFLSVIAFHFYDKSISDMNIIEMDSFIESYKKVYNLPIDDKEILVKLSNARILPRDSCGNYYFSYQYLFYFFVAKYLSDHINENKQHIDSIVANLHLDRNAYILVFLSHHTKNNYILDELVLNSLCLFDSYLPATLSVEELSFFDKQIEQIINVVFPTNHTTPEAERERHLKIKEAAEEHDEEVSDCKEEHQEKNDLERDLRRSIKTVEVMGRIIKNRSGSLDKTRLEQILMEAMNVLLRILSSFLCVIKENDYQEEIVAFISEQIEDYISKQKKAPDKYKLHEYAKKLFWNLNFVVVYSITSMVVRSLGSDKLQMIMNQACDKIGTAASSIIKHGTLMWNSKNIQVDNIAKEFDDKSYSETAKRIMRQFIVSYSSVHKIDFKDKQKIESKLGMSGQKLLVANYNASSKVT